MENDRPSSPKLATANVVFWVVIALLLVFLFNIDDRLPKVMGYSGATVIAGAIVVLVWIGFFIHSKWKSRA